MVTSLDNTKSNRNSGFCGRHTAGGPAGPDSFGLMRFSRLRCKSWGCPKCGKKKLKKLKRAIGEQATEKSLNRFLTLTIDPKTCTAEESWDLIKDAWAKFRIYLKRKLGVTPNFIWVVEPQKSGYAHFHVLIDSYLEHAWISKTWQACGGGKIVYIVRTETLRSVGAYLAKYFTKSFQENYFQKGKRRYGSARGIILIPKTTAPGWSTYLPKLEEIVLIAGGTLRKIFEDADGEVSGVEVEFPSFMLLKKVE